MLAILAADVVGYSRQMEADEAGTIARVTALRREVLEPALAAHRGRLVKLMGDGALAVFESVVDAVACAAAIQRAVADWGAGRPEGERLVLRIGVNLGDVALIDGDVYGDGVNVAARLEQLCEPGGVMVSGTAFDHLQGKLGFPLEFAGQQKVKNISRPVRAYRARLDGKARRPRRAARWPLRALAAAFAALLAAGAGWWWSSPSAPARRPSIAVLPFDVLGGDAATARLAEGITDEIITDLARFRAVDVIARESTRAYRDQPVDMAEIGRALNVRYVLDGRVQREGDRLRVTAQLIDAASERDVWADRWDRRAEDLFAVQSELAEAVASHVASAYSGAIVTAERDAAKRKPPKSLTAYDLYLLGIEARERATREGLEQAVAYLERSLGIDPGFSRAWTALAVAYADLAEMQGYPAALQEARETAARKAVELDPADPAAHAALATVHMDKGDAGRAEAEFDKALALNPGSADLLAIYAGWASDFGEPEQGVEAAERAMRLNPASPAWAVYNAGYAYFMAGRHGEALRMLDRFPKEAYTPATHVYRAAALGALGRSAEAKQAVAEALARSPGLSVESFVGLYGSNDAQRRLLTDTMRQAGFPVCASEATLKANPDLRRLPECLTS
jgi:TolB-like protein/class 3 adenylate cyclase/Tfp pilus assembly protein PilF